jgi:hypothetical protein
MGGFRGLGWTTQDMLCHCLRLTGLEYGGTKEVDGLRRGYVVHGWKDWQALDLVSE